MRITTSNQLVQHQLIVKPSSIHGFGVFADRDFKKGQLIEQCYFLLVNDKSTELDDYTFGLSQLSAQQLSALPLGYGALYNHSSSPNAEFEEDVAQQVINFFARTDIKRGEEIFISYGSSWFDSRDLKSLEPSKIYRFRRFLRHARASLRMILVGTFVMLLIGLLADYPFAL